jgi:hypothetical protein
MGEIKMKQQRVEQAKCFAEQCMNSLQESIREKSPDDFRNLVAVENVRAILAVNIQLARISMVLEEIIAGVPMAGRGY